VRVTDSSGKWLWVAKEFAGDFAPTAGSDEAKGIVHGKGAPSEAAKVNPKERVPSDNNSNDLARAATDDEGVATVTHGGSEEAKNSGDINADSTSSGAATDSKRATPQSPPQCPTCCLLC